jgi:hypothetical protein
MPIHPAGSRASENALRSAMLYARVACLGFSVRLPVPARAAKMMKASGGGGSGDAAVTGGSARLDGSDRRHLR